MDVGQSLIVNAVRRLSYLDNRLGSVTDSQGEEYAPVAAYRHSLLMGEIDTTVQSTKLAAPAAGAKRRGAKRKLIADGECDFVRLTNHYIIHCIGLLSFIS